jgi:hypothetical protein
VFTSIDDNTVGAAIGTGSPARGDCAAGVTVGSDSAESSSQLTGSRLIVRYATIGIHIVSGTAQVSDLDIGDSGTGFLVDGGSVAIRGSLRADTRGIQACDWAQQCFVDATNVDWGTTAGPFPPSGDLVCGSVSVNPWQSQTASSRVFAVKNCDGSDTPDTVVTTVANEFNMALGSALSSECDGLPADTCQVIQTAYNCIEAAFTLATNSIPGAGFVLPEESPGEQASEFASDYLGSFGNYLTQEAPTGLWSDAASLTKFGGAAIGVVGTILSLANAYHSCAP